MINLLSIAPYSFLPAQGGGQKAIYLLYKYISQKVYLTVVSTKSNKPEKVSYPVFRFFPDSPFRYINLFYYYKINRLVKKKNITHLSIEHPYMGLLGLFVKSQCNLKFVIRSHNIESLRFKTIGKWWWWMLFHYEKFVHKRADHSFFITEEDRQYAIKHYQLKEDKTSVLTYGTEIYDALTEEQKREQVKQLKAEHNIPESSTLLLFNGTFDYEPNLMALKLLLHHTMPIILEKDENCFLLVCGKNIPPEISSKEYKNVKILGFVDDIHAVFKGSEIFLNPVWLGGGIKTKLVEALGYGCSAVSFANGALGIPEGIVDDKISVVKDLDYHTFAEEVIKIKLTIYKTTPHKFYFQFGWENIAQRFVDIINVID